MNLARGVHLFPASGLALESQPQRVVMLDQPFQTFFQKVGAGMLLQLQHHGLVVMMRLRRLLLEEPALNRRQRYEAFNGLLFRRALARGFCYGGEF